MSLPSTPCLKVPRPSPSTRPPRNRRVTVISFFWAWDLAFGCHDEAWGLPISWSLNALRMVCFCGAMFRVPGVCGCTINHQNRVWEAMNSLNTTRCVPFVTEKSPSRLDSGVFPRRRGASSLTRNSMLSVHDCVIESILRLQDEEGRETPINHQNSVWEAMYSLTRIRWIP